MLVIIALGTIAGTFFSVVPLLPGGIFVPLAAIGASLALGWDAVPVWAWVGLVVLLVMSLLVDNVAQALGVRRVGGSRGAMLGGAIGVFVGPLVLAPFTGPIALLVGPPVGAIAGTLLGEARSRPPQDAAGTAPGYRSLGVGALLAYVAGTGIKLLLVAAQAVLLLAAILG